MSAHDDPRDTTADRRPGQRIRFVAGLVVSALIGASAILIVDRVRGRDEPPAPTAEEEAAPRPPGGSQRPTVDPFPVTVPSTTTSTAPAVAPTSAPAPPPTPQATTARPATATPPAIVGTFVAPGGVGDGSLERPASLASVLARGAAPGTTIWMRGGVYRQLRNLTISQRGERERPITLRSFPGEWAVLDGADDPTGAVITMKESSGWWVLRDFEITNSATNRSNRGQGLKLYGVGVKVINTVIHDVGTCIGAWGSATEAEIYGNVLFNCGGARRDHAIYSQNNGAKKVIEDNVMSNSFGFNLHIYTEQGQLKGYDIIGNTAVGGGQLDPGEDSPNIFVGGFTPASAIRIVENHTYEPGRSGNAGIRLGYASTPMQDVLVRDNYLAQLHPLQIRRWSSASVEQNTFVSEALLALVEGTTVTSWDRNTYYRGRFERDGRRYSFDEWRGAFSIDASSSWSPGSPPGRLFVRPNRHEAGRATVTVYNWERLPSVSVPLGGLLRSGQRYEVRDAQNWHAPPIAQGTVSGSSITIPMTDRPSAQPIGLPAARPSSPEFGVFIVRALP